MNDAKGRSWLYHHLGRDGAEGGVPDIEPGAFELGDHDNGYWRRIVPAVLEFVGDALA